MITITARIVRIIAQDTAAVIRDLLRLVFNPLGQTTVAHAARLRGATPEWLKKWCSALGRLAAKLHRQAHGTEPSTAWEADRRGKIVTHFAYAVDAPELLEALDFYAVKTGGIA